MSCSLVCASWTFLEKYRCQVFGTLTNDKWEWTLGIKNSIGRAHRKSFLWLQDHWYSPLCSLRYFILCLVPFLCAFVCHITILVVHTVPASLLLDWLCDIRLKRAYKALSRTGSGHHHSKKKDLLENKPPRENFPQEWLTAPELPPQEPITMTESFTSRLPRVLICLHYASGLSKPNAYVKIRILIFSTLWFSTS